MRPNDTRDVGDTVGCGHPACLCAAGESGYCSGFCEQQGGAMYEDEGEGVCGCGHADCAAAA